MILKKTQFFAPNASAQLIRWHSHYSQPVSSPHPLVHPSDHSSVCPVQNVNIKENTFYISLWHSVWILDIISHKLSGLVDNFKGESWCDHAQCSAPAF